MTYQLEKLSGGRTLLTFHQSGVPNKHAADIRAGWKNSYWKPLRSWLHDLQNSAPGKKTKSKARKKVAKKKSARRK